jgi:signal transduction histidine kinase
MLLNQQQSRDSVARLTHELLQPLNVLQGATYNIRKDMRAAGISVGQVLKHDYLSDISSYTSLFGRLARNINFFGLEDLSPDCEKGPYYLMKHIVAPTVTQLRAYLRDSHVRYNPFTYEGFEEIPRLWIGKHYFQQIVFNLMTNAIKYAFEDPRDLSIQVKAERSPDAFLVHFSDWGVGVPHGFEEAIFRKHVRAPGAVEKVATGLGLGLWIVRRLVEAHDGTVWLSNRHLPTRFTIALPSTLEYRPPGAGR